MSDKKEWREWYFEYMNDTKEYGQLSDRPPYARDTSFELVHVVEVSALEELQAELKEWKDQAYVDAERADNLQAELKDAYAKIAEMTTTINSAWFKQQHGTTQDNEGADNV